MMSRSLGHLGESFDWRDVPDYWLGPFWVGNFCSIATKDYGSNKFHGRFHPAIAYVAMKRFTQPGDVVWDCFAGSGTTIDVGIELGRVVIANDLHSTRQDIIQADTSLWRPDRCVDLIIAHPPYAGIIDYKSPMSSASTIAEFVGEFMECFYNMDAALKHGKVLVLVVGEIWFDGQLHPLEYPLDGVVRGVFGYRLVGRIVKDFGETKGGSTTTSDKSGNLWKSRLVRFGYFRNGIDTILFYQKI